MFAHVYTVFCKYLQILLWEKITNVFKTVTELNVAFGYFIFSHSEDTKTAAGDV